MATVPGRFVPINRTQMLHWNRVDDSWFAPHYRIDRIAPRAWLLTSTGPADSPQVLVEDGPIAVLPSLQACQHKAQSLKNEELLTAKRKRLGAVSAVALSVAVLWSSAPLAAALAGVVGVATLIDLGLTWVERGHVGSVGDLVQ